MRLDDTPRKVPMFSLVCAFCQHHELTVDHTCQAYPDGIPLPIWTGENGHRTPYAGDHGVQFEPWEDGARKALKAVTPRDEAEARLMAALSDLFAKLAPDVAARLAKGEMPDEQELSQALSGIIQPELAQVAAEEFGRLGVEVGVQFDPAIVNLALSEWARAYTFDLVRGLTETTRKALQAAMDEFARTPGMTRGQLEALLEPTFGKVRAEAIAITEVTRGAQAGMDRYQTELADAGVSMVQIYRTARDENVCPVCSPDNGKPEPEWTAGGRPPRHSRCRCFCTLTLAPETKSGEDATKYNPYHDRLGRFTSGGGASLVSIRPGGYTQQQKERIAGATGGDKPGTAAAAEAAARQKPKKPAGVPDWALESHPGLGRYGDALKVTGNRVQISPDHLTGLDKVPPRVVDKLRASGVTWEVGAGGMPTLDRQQGLRGKVPRGWEGSGYTWDDVAAGFQPGSNAVLLGNGLGHSSGTISGHETGHAVETLGNFATDPGVIAGHRRLYAKLSPYLQQGGAGGRVGCEEMLAEVLSTSWRYGPRVAGGLFDDALVRHVNKLVADWSRAKE